MFNSYWQACQTANTDSTEGISDTVDQYRAELGKKRKQTATKGKPLSWRRQNVNMKIVIVSAGCRSLVRSVPVTYYYDVKDVADDGHITGTIITLQWFMNYDYKYSTKRKKIERGIEWTEWRDNGGGLCEEEKPNRTLRVTRTIAVAHHTVGRRCQATAIYSLDFHFDILIRRRRISTSLSLWLSSLSITHSFEFAFAFQRKHYTVAELKWNIYDRIGIIHERCGLMI